jgi:hypothetical protein
MSSFDKVKAVVVAVDAAMRTAFGWDGSVPIYVNGSDQTPPTGSTYGMIEIDLPQIGGENDTPVSHDAQIAMQVGGHWPLTAASGSSPGEFQLEKGLALFAALTASPSIGEAFLPVVGAVDLDDTEAREENAIEVSVPFSCYVTLVRGE